MPGVYTIQSYDTNVWEPVDLITVSHNEAISGLRDFGMNITQLFGGKMALLEKKVKDLREGVIAELEQYVKGPDMMIIGLDMETNLFERTLIIVATGTLLRRKGSGTASAVASVPTGGKRATRRVRKH